MLKQISTAATVVLLSVLPAPAQQPPGFATYLIAFVTQATTTRAAGDIAELRASHDAHLAGLWKEGLLVAAGPIAEKSAFVEVLIFTADQRALIEKRIADNPLVKAGLVDVALGPWVAPSGIGDEYRKRAAAGSAAVPEKLRTYQLVMLKAVLGTHVAPDEQRGLLLQMDAMAKAGTLVAAGPVLEGSDLVWVFVFNANAQETDVLMEANPAVKAGKIVAERHPWTVPEGVLPAGFKMPLQ
jgi:uncharacterized protein